MDETSAYQIKIDRPIYEHDQLRKDFAYEKTKTNRLTKVINQCKKNCTFSLYKIIPALHWLAHYKWKRDILSDLLSGFTVAIMHIPQGMAYGLLGNVPPIVGIYMAFFPVIIYFFLGTSKHISMGTFAVVCLMTGKAVLEHSDPKYFFKKIDEENIINDTMETFSEGYSPVEVATAVTFTVALFQLAMFVLRMGAASALLSQTLVSGLTTGAAFQVISSQIKDLLGLDIPKHKGLFVVINTLRSVFLEISDVNFAAIIISAITISITVFNNELLKPLVARKTTFPIPIELIAIVVGTLVSKYFYLEETYSVKVVGSIPSGLPVPKLPPLSLMSDVVLDAFSIAVVSYTLSLSMALMFAQKLNYEIDANQELLAQGTSNIFGSFFSCMPFAASLSRSSIQQAVGGKTQLTSIVSCSILLTILFWIGPFFEPLPKSVLASVIVVALKGMIMQVQHFWKFLKLSKMDALVWMATFLTVIFISIDIGLLVGAILSLTTVFILNFKPYTCLLGAVPHTDIYMDIKKYKGATEVPGIKIFHYRGGLNFASTNLFKSELFRLLELNPQKEIIYRRKLAKLLDQVNVKNNKTENKIAKFQHKINAAIRCLILDFSCVSYVDPSGVTMLQSITENLQKLDIPVYIAACSEPIYEMISKCGLIDRCNKNPVRLFPTVHDAVESANEIFTSSSNVSIISRM